MKGDRCGWVASLAGVSMDRAWVWVWSSTGICTSTTECPDLPTFKCILCCCNAVDCLVSFVDLVCVLFYCVGVLWFVVFGCMVASFCCAMCSLMCVVVLFGISVDLNKRNVNLLSHGWGGGPCSRIDMSGIFPTHVSAESPSNISPNPSEVIPEVSEP